MHRAKGDRFVRASGLPVRQWTSLMSLATHNANILARPDDTSSRSLALWVTSDIWLVPFYSRTSVVTEFIVRNSKKLNF